MKKITNVMGSIILVGIILYIFITNIGHVGNLKQQQANAVARSKLSYTMDQNLLPVEFFSSFRKYEITNRMECLNNQRLESCIDYCRLLVETTKYTEIVNLWDCVDAVAKIPPKIYGYRKCNSLNRKGEQRPSKKKCYDDININKENLFKGVYDAKHSYCKWEIRNVDYD